jgi:hypothetical protein
MVASFRSVRNLHCVIASVFSFAGDLGGYYGLFLGGSAISIFEILDLIVYNALIKFMRRRRPKQTSRIEPSHQMQVIQVKGADEESQIDNRMSDINIDTWFKRSTSAAQVGDVQPMYLP